MTARQILLSAAKRFRAEKAIHYETTFHFIINKEEELQMTIKIHHGVCEVVEHLEGKPNCIVETSAANYIALETGTLNPQMGLMLGKVKVSSLTEMMQFAKCFRKFSSSFLENQQKPKRILAERSPQNGPLKGIKVLDFTRLLPGPLATMFLADMGAEIIKIEDPDSPDYIRSFEPMIQNNSAFYYALNRTKKSLCINYLHEKGREIIYQLIAEADVVIEQFRPGTMKHFGFDYENCKRIQPKIIYVAITGYGQDNSLSQTAGHDLNYIALAGLLGINGKEEVTIPGFQLADIAGGAYMALNAITTALFQRERTGEGCFVDVSMTDCVLPFLTLPFAEYQSKKTKTARGDFQLSGTLANYNVYLCADKKYLAIGSLEPKFWKKFCTKIGKAEWAEKILENDVAHQQMKTELKSIIQTKTRDEWVTFLEHEDACVSAVLEIDEVEDAQHFKERNLFIEQDIAEQKLKSIAMPLRFSSQQKTVNWIAPNLGEDTYAILIKLGIPESVIEKLFLESIVK